MSEYVAYTPLEGAWGFTRSTTRDEAIEKMVAAIRLRRVLRYPVGNPVSTVIYEPDSDHQH